MKKTVLLITATIAITWANAQSAYYTVSQASDTYLNLPDSTKTVLESSWASPFFADVIMGVGTEMFGAICDTSIGINSRGELFTSDYSTHSLYYMVGMGTESYGVGAEVSYELDGVAPNEILKIQYDSIGFQDESPHESYVNFQVWLYQNSNIIEFRYGPSYLYPSGGISGLSVGLYYVVGGSTTSTVKSVVLKGNPAAPTVDTGAWELETTLTGFPSNGTVYRFYPNATAVPSVEPNSENIIVRYAPDQKQVNINSTKNIDACEVYNLFQVRLWHRILMSIRIT